VIERPLSQQDVFRFQERYNKWKAGQEEAVTGTPLSALPGMNASKVEEYKFFKIITVEQLADANDNLGGKFMSFQQDKQRAKAFMEVAANNAPIEKMNAELQKRDAEIENLRTMVEALQASAKPAKRNVAPATADVE
jgi:predicted RecB family nuclease